MSTTRILFKAQIAMFFIFAILVMSSAGLAATYYVDKNHPNANDSNPGTEVSPWLTIKHAVDTVSAGDTVYIKEGIYTERVSLTGSTGTEGKSGNATDGYITYAGYPNEAVIMDGSSFSWGGAFNSGMYTGTATLRVVHYIKIKDLTVRDYPENGISFYSDQDTVGTGSHHIIFENLIIHNNGFGGIWFEGGVGAGTTHDIIVRNCTVYNNGNHGIKLTGDSPGVINREHIHDSIIENNVVYGNGQSSGGIGIHVSTGHYNITVRNNVCYNNARQGIAAHEIWDSTYENNTVYSNGQGPETEDEGIVIWHSRNITVRGNTIYNNPGFGLSFWKDLLGTGSSPTVENNLIFNNNGGGLGISTDINNGKIYHNTIASNQGTGLSINSSVSGHDIKNNILYQNSVQISPGSGNTYDYNEYFPDVTFSGKDTHFISENPLFVNPSNDDFHLTSTSPTVDSGIDVGNNIDIEGNLRPKGNGYDIGAYEYNTSGDNEPPAPPTGVTIISTQ